MSHLHISNTNSFYCETLGPSSASKFGAVPNGGRKAIISKRTQPKDLTTSQLGISNGIFTMFLYFVKPNMNVIRYNIHTYSYSMYIMLQLHTVHIPYK